MSCQNSALTLGFKESGIFWRGQWQEQKLKLMGVVVILLGLSPYASAEWVQMGENNRSIAYIDTAIRRSGNVETYWVLFDYKAVQESPRSGRRYLSEKTQHEIECQSERDRAVFFTWHSEQMGNGVVIYTGKKPTNWEPTSSPGSFANIFWKFVCSKK